MAILLIEDDIDLGNMLAQFIEIENFEVVHAFDGRNALEFINRGKFELAIIDVYLQEEDGFDIAKIIQQKIPSIPFIFMTTENRNDEIMARFKFEAVDYICKPFEPAELVSMIHKTLKSKIQ
jgi:DNA-binding response OmpR family regulator